MRLKIGLALVLALVAVALLAPVLSPYPPAAQLDLYALRAAAPSLAHPLGTDQYSRDLLSRLLNGARISLTIALLAVAISVTVGTLVGLVAGYAGGLADATLMRVVDAGLARGDRVIRYPTSMLKDGQAVQAAAPMRASMAASGPRGAK